MKIAFTGLELPEGKVKHEDTVFAELTRKFQPAKVSPHYIEFLFDGYDAAGAIAIKNDRLLDLLVQDMEKLEGRLSRSEDAAETELLRKSLEHLEDEKPLCDMAADEGERTILRHLGPLSFKPTVVFSEQPGHPSNVTQAVLDKAGMMFFYTAGPREVHAWLVEKGTDAAGCAARIHSDLARGFIKAELVSFEDLMSAHNMQDARSKGLTRLVDREHVVPENTVLEIRFNV
jgi:ribosome-binding ATPase YchF (GTP1/OBG family)